ncbi:hypothetical protein BGX27_008464 [Mortierella sp. AM989]|nr:hypothetical protein BGX27_008464 [Mortierella sp. AM989]
MATFSLSHIRILRTKLLSCQTQSSFTRACQRRARPSRSCLLVENQYQKRFISSTKTSFTTAHNDKNSKSTNDTIIKITDKTTDISETASSRVEEVTRFIPRHSARVDRVASSPLRVETPKVSKYRVDKNSPKTGRIAKLKEEKRAKKAAAAAFRAAQPRPISRYRLIAGKWRKSTQPFVDDSSRSMAPRDSISNSKGNGSSRGSSSWRGKEDNASLDRNYGRGCIIDKRDAASFWAAREDDFEASFQPKSKHTNSNMLSRGSKLDIAASKATAAPAETVTTKATMTSLTSTPIPQPSQSIPAPSTLPKFSDQNQRGENFSTIKQRRVEDSTRRAIESSSTSPSQAPLNMDRNIYRTILDWSVHPTVQPDEFNTISDAQRTMVRTKRLASVKRSSWSQIPRNEATGASSSRVFQWPYNTKSDIRNEMINTTNVTDLVSKNPSRIDPLQGDYSVRGAWVGNPTESHVKEIEKEKKKEREEEREGGNRYESNSATVVGRLRGSRARIGFGFNSLEDHDIAKDSRQQSKDSTKKLLKVEKERLDPPVDITPKLPLNEYLHTPRLVLPAITAGNRTISKLYYSEDSTISPQEQNLDYEKSEWPLVSDVLKRAKAAHVKTFKVTQKQLDEIVPDNKGVVLESSSITRHLASGLNSISEERVYQLNLQKAEAVEFKKPTVSTASSSSKQSSVNGSKHQPIQYPLWVAIEQVADPNVMGQFIRTAFYMGADGLLYWSQKCTPPSTQVALASAGSMEQHTIYPVKSLINFLKASKLNGWHVIGAHVSLLNTRARPYHHWPEWGVDKPTILVINENGYRLSDSIAKKCDKFFAMPYSKKSDIGALDSDVILGVALSKLVNRKF